MLVTVSGISNVPENLWGTYKRIVDAGLNKQLVMPELKNELNPMDVTLFGIVIDVRWEQFLNACSAIFVTPSGIETDVSWVQLANA